MRSLPQPLRIGALARLAGLSPDTLRHYERLGVLPRASRTTGGFREYPMAATRRVRVVQEALKMGFTLAELAGVFKERTSGRHPCMRVRALAEDKLRALEARMVELRRLHGDLVRTLAAWDARLAASGPGAPAGLLDSLADRDSGSGASSSGARGGAPRAGTEGRARALRGQRRPR
jgi:MerR family copper efflux transcriptional regulator